ncbi:MAG: HAMP domain-containing histidine kinase [Chloroflexi bacterium]|nr:HAMP domain-containing histidine kinase [Chloroflexota bacterium]
MKKKLGLGLAIAREIVLVYNGTIEVSSTSDEGTEFVVRLPAGSSAVP